MKKATINLSYDEEKLTALRVHLAQKNLDLDTELNTALDNLFKKHVHPAVRVYIESKDSTAKTT